LSINEYLIDWLIEMIFDDMYFVRNDATKLTVDEMIVDEMIFDEMIGNRGGGICKVKYVPDTS